MMKLLLSVLLVLLAVALIGYGIGTNRLAAEDQAFIQHHPAMDLFPATWLWKGRAAYYDRLDPATAAFDYRQAIARQPLMIDAWLALAKVELVRGERPAAQRIMDLLEPRLAQVSTWKWQQLLLAYDLQAEDHFAAAFNFILARLPHHAANACYLAARFWGNWAAILPHVAPDNRLSYFNQLMRARQVDAALALWQTLAASKTLPEKSEQIRFCRFLLGSKRLAAAETIWANLSGSTVGQIYNGGFEKPPLHAPFAWNIGKTPDVSADRTSVFTYAGQYALRLHFKGTKNINYYQVYQLVPVKPGQHYVLHFAEKSRGITTDQGVFVEVSGYRCRGLYVHSNPLTGTHPWQEQQLSIAVPADCQAIQVRVRRKPSLMFDNKIQGDYWLDAVELRKAADGSQEAKAE